MHDDGISGSHTDSELVSASASLKQRQFFTGPGNAIGPVVLH